MGQANISQSPENTVPLSSQRKSSRFGGFFLQFNELNQLTEGSRTSEPIQGGLEHGGPQSQQATAPEVKPFPGSKDLIGSASARNLHPNLYFNPRLTEIKVASE